MFRGSVLRAPQGVTWTGPWVALLWSLTALRVVSGSTTKVQVATRNSIVSIARLALISMSQEATVVQFV